MTTDRAAVTGGYHSTCLETWCFTSAAPSVSCEPREAIVMPILLYFLFSIFASSIRRLSKNPCKACFVADYTAVLGGPIHPAKDDITTIRPEFL